MAQISSARIEPDERDRAIVHANGIVVDVIANEDGSVYVETYAEDSRLAGEAFGTVLPFPNRRQVVVQHAAIDRYTERHPNLRLELAEVRITKEVPA